MEGGEERGKRKKKEGCPQKNDLTPPRQVGQQVSQKIRLQPGNIFAPLHPKPFPKSVPGSQNFRRSNSDGVEQVGDLYPIDNIGHQRR
jgi:hypothetical protein